MNKPYEYTLNTLTEKADLFRDINIFVKDINLRYLVSNISMLKMLGITREQILGKKDEECYWSRDSLLIAKTKEYDNAVIFGNNLLLREESPPTLLGDRVILFSVKTQIYKINDLFSPIGLIGASRLSMKEDKEEIKKTLMSVLHMLQSVVNDCVFKDINLPKNNQYVITKE